MRPREYRDVKLTFLDLVNEFNAGDRDRRVVEALESRDHGYVLETGRVVLHGPRDAIMSDARVQRAYLGI